jgi:hypothetical protein
VHLDVAPWCCKVLQWLEPNCSALVVYDAGNCVWDDKNAGVFWFSGNDKL